ncbi:hypothetical protein Tfer_1018 [Thermincola ferriacetica]|uniref:Uncharacterized protein n=1 Tax=Thermincola ferriacetica TaxID=281456 RepID=A0A0L6W4X1_9FIRM|nr:hypothetical protein [Thermincola ferriacetica]KNZ70149.1 hypothetical protein Tfer_1018 [Thermincola ferriacetica]
MYFHPYHPGFYPGYSYPYSPMGENPSQIIACTDPIVQHGMKELKARVPIRHVLREVAAAAYLAGMGYAPTEAIAAVERWEEMGYFPPARR